jgi:anti-sigma regulatory factor (Ser/Thr protein kinase)
MTRHPHAETVGLSPIAGSSARARTFVTELATAFDFSADAVQRAALAVSEVVTNAIVYGRPPILLSMTVGDGVARIEVHDGAGGSFPEVRADPDVGGRGLAIVDRVTSSWGCRADRDGRGKTVWFTVAR